MFGFKMTQYPSWNHLFGRRNTTDWKYAKPRWEIQGRLTVPIETLFGDQRPLRAHGRTPTSGLMTGRQAASWHEDTQACAVTVSKMYTPEVPATANGSWHFPPRLACWTSDTSVSHIDYCYQFRCFCADDGLSPKAAACGGERRRRNPCSGNRGRHYRFGAFGVSR